MKLAAVALALMPGIAIASSWTSQGLPNFEAEGTGKFVSHAALRYKIGRASCRERV